jgi:protein-disulfide isomerase
MTAKSFLVPQIALALGFTVAACQPVPDANVNKKLDEISQKLDNLEKKVGAAGQMPQRPQPPAGPDPTAVYSVPVDGAPIKGPKHAKVTLVKAFEFACPFCERVNPTLAELQKKYGNDLRIVAKHFIVHPDTATLPAQAACAGHKQGKYVEMEEALWEKAFKANRNFSEDNMMTIAKSIGLNTDKFAADMKGECAKVVQEDHRQMAQVGVRGTPAFYINGRFISGAQPIENFQRVIDEELKKANEAVAKGVKVEDYYSETVVKGGKKTI